MTFGGGCRVVFGLAATLPTGKPSFGAALLFRQSDTLGLTDSGLSAGALSHRLLAARMAAEKLEPCLVVVGYFEVSVGLNEMNRTLLSLIAQWQEASQLPAIVGSDFNVAPRALRDSTLTARSGLAPMAPAGATYRTSKSAWTLDYSLMAPGFGERVVEVKVHSGFPLRPRSPVSSIVGAAAADKTPVLDMPPKLPLNVPVGPSLQLRCWRALGEKGWVGPATLQWQPLAGGAPATPGSGVRSLRAGVRVAGLRADRHPQANAFAAGQDP